MRPALQRTAHIPRPSRRTVEARHSGVNGLLRGKYPRQGNGTRKGATGRFPEEPVTQIWAAAAEGPSPLSVPPPPPSPQHREKKGRARAQLSSVDPTAQSKSPELAGGHHRAKKGGTRLRISTNRESFLLDRQRK